VYGPEEKVLLKSEPVIINAEGGTDAAATDTPATATTETIPTTAPTVMPTSASAVTTTLNVVTQTEAGGVDVASQTLTATATVAGVANANGSPSLTVTSEGANVRAGPGTEYPVVGQLPNGATAAVRGKNADATWWQITLETAPTGLGWVRADLAEANDAAASVQVVNVAPLPTQTPQPTPGPGTVVPTVDATTIPATAAPQTTAASAERACNPETPGWAGADSRYPFCVAKVLTWHDNQDGAHRYENGSDVPASLSWDIWGVDGVWMVFDQDDSGYCDFTRQAAKTINEPVPNAGTYAFNVKDFPGGATLRIFLRVKRTDGQVVEFGDKRLCIY
jgi:uncharacterized protein YraI